MTILGQALRWFSPPRPLAPTRDAKAFDAAAVPFALDYLSWYQDGRPARQTALRRAAAPNITIDGWDGTGRQWADSATAIGIARRGDERAVVTVRVRVTAYTVREDTSERDDPTAPTTPDSQPAAPSTVPSDVPSTTQPSQLGNDASGPALSVPGWSAQPPRWLNLAVPLRRLGDRVLVIATPALVGSAPASADPPAVPDPSTQTDAQFANHTRNTVRTLLDGYSSGNLAYARAAGTTFTGLDNAVTLDSITTWRVRELPTTGQADSKTRVGDVTVTWTLPTGTHLTSAYRIELRQDTGRWYLASLGAMTEAGFR